MAAALLDKAYALQFNTLGPGGFPPGPLLCFVIFLVPIFISSEKTVYPVCGHSNAGIVEWLQIHGKLKKICSKEKDLGREKGDGT